MSEQWLSIVDYARTNNLSDMTVRRRIKTGRLEAVLRDGKYFIKKEQIQNNRTSPLTTAPTESLHERAPATSMDKQALPLERLTEKTQIHTPQQRTQNHLYSNIYPKIYLIIIFDIYI